MRKIAIIGGTGIYSPEALQGFAEKIIDTPYGQALFNIGEIAGNQVVFITRHGVGHKTAPHKVNYRANIWALKSLGTEEIFATTAVGSLNPEMKAGHFVVCSNVLDFTKSRINTFYDTPERGVVHVDFSYPYCPCVRERVIRCLEKMNITFHKEGVYVATEGPRFESAAEIKAYAMLGGDLVVTSGLGGYYPEGLVIGSVKEVRLDDSGAASYAILEPAVDFDGLTEVFVIKSFDIVT